MTLSSTEIDAVVGELGPLLTGGWIQKVSQPTSQEVTLEIRVPGRTLVLLVSVDPRTARVHVLSGRIPNPLTPPPFCQYLRAHIRGSRIEGLTRVREDRIVRMRLLTRNGQATLVAALTGRSADLLLLDSEEKILNSLKHGLAKAGERYETPVRRASGRERDHAETVFDRTPGSEHAISSALERRYAHREEELARDTAQQTRLSQIRKTMKRVGRRTEALRADLERAERYRDYARYGELLKSDIGRLTKGMDRFVTVDYFDPAMPELVIPLDPSKSPRGNMDEYFKKHRKHLSAEREIQPRLNQLERELDDLRRERQAIEQGTWQPPTPQEAPGRLAPRARDGSATPKGHDRSSARSGPFRRFTSADGLPIYVGRNARENEELTHKFARSDDVWLHARGSPGSHVVVRLEKGADLPHETLRDAATLALLYSDLRKSGKGEVIYTRKKWVRKAKGQPAGTVTVTQEKSLFVNLDQARLTRLKERAR